MTPVLQAKDLSLTLSGRKIFQIDELTLHKGQVLALIGPNGAGKSSLLQTLALLQPSTQGVILFDGAPVQRKDLLRLRRRMAVVFQEALLLDMTVERNVKIPLLIRGMPHREADSRTQLWLERFGISHLAGRKARQLSGGEAQRTSLARAFALDPEILFLDEPFSALDHPTRMNLLEEVGKILKDMHTTALFVTHDYTEIPYLASEAAVLFEGRIIKRGLLRDIFGEEIFQKKIWTPWEVV